ncbi:MAG: hypothetical protein CBC46_10880 [Verrucomicrobiaceae bacterium TMED86]|nr:MAG: hypothetical protein CBC46_10880 [Verrucomicrobiaceae bacterium TMED86]
MLSAKLREHPNSGEASDYNPVHSGAIAAFGSGRPVISRFNLHPEVRKTTASVSQPAILRFLDARRIEVAKWVLVEK